MNKSDFDLRQFLPYVLNRAAEATSIGFEQNYRERYGMLRTEWRVLFHLGRYGALTAKEICARAGLHKTKVSRAVSALEKKRFLERSPQEHDRRLETLTLSRQGQLVYDDLSSAAQSYDAALAAQFTPEERDVLQRCLARLAQF